MDPESVTVSGISAGAAMATQLHVALSGLVHGSAIFGGCEHWLVHFMFSRIVMSWETILRIGQILL